jgi:asparagine synthase (glutamine-hydrolysing)
LNAEEFAGNFEDFVETHEEPVTGLSLYAQYCVMKLAHENGAKVLLDGQGGDEIFAGYIYYYTYFYYELMKKMKWFKLIAENIHYMFNFKNFYPQEFLAFQLMPRKLKLFMFDKVLNKWLNHKLLRELCIDGMDERWEKRELREAMILTLVKTSIPHLLRWEDKNSMRWSIESRVPFLDFNLVEAAMSVPSEKKLKDGRTKIIFKEAVDDILPEMIKNRKDKIGFAAPDSEFFRNPKVMEYCKAIIESESFGKRPYWNVDNVRRIYNNFITGKSSDCSSIMKWINLEVWFRKYID